MAGLSVAVLPSPSHLKVSLSARIALPSGVFSPLYVNVMVALFGWTICQRRPSSSSIRQSSKACRPISLPCYPEATEGSERRIGLHIETRGKCSQVLRSAQNDTLERVVSVVVISSRCEGLTRRAVRVVVSPGCRFAVLVGQLGEASCIVVGIRSCPCTFDHGRALVI